MTRSAGRVALVTGSGRGIGFGIAERLAGEGALVVLNDIDAESLDAAAERLRRQGGTVDAVAADVGDLDDVERLFGHILATHGRIDVLVNNAALANPVAHFFELDLARWSDVLRSNLDSVFLCTRFAAEEMARARIAGAVINISSFGAFRAHRSLVAYDTAKGGIEAFTRAASLDLAPYGIRVNSVVPGSIRTGDTDEQASRRAVTVPLGRIGAPRDVAEAVAFLASDHAQFITGQALVVDGGALAQLRPAPLDTPSWTIGDLESRTRLLETRMGEPAHD